MRMSKRVASKAPVYNFDFIDKKIDQYASYASDDSSVEVDTTFGKAMKSQSKNPKDSLVRGKRKRRSVNYSESDESHQSEIKEPRRSSRPRSERNYKESDEVEDDQDVDFLPEKKSSKGIHSFFGKNTATLGATKKSRVHIKRQRKGERQSKRATSAKTYVFDSDEDEFLNSDYESDSTNSKESVSLYFQHFKTCFLSHISRNHRY